MIVVIGGGIAGVNCVQTLCEECPEECVVLVTNSSIIKVASNVTKVGQNLESFEIEEKGISVFDSLPNVKVVIGFVTAIDSNKREVYLKNSNTIKYTKLCICTGGRPKLIKFKNENILGIRDTESIEHFAERLKSAERVVVVGNGGIALELVHHIENCELFWIMKDETIGTTFFDAHAAHFLLSSFDRKIEKNEIVRRSRYIAVNNNTSKSGFGSALGPDWKETLQEKNLQMKGICSTTKKVMFEFKCEVHSVYSPAEVPQEKTASIIDELNKWPVFVQLTNGKILGCNFVVSATGVIPNVVPLLNGDFKIAADGGIEVNKEMMTSESDIYAAGDVCTATWDTPITWFQMRLWTQAKQMGMYTAYCMSSHKRNTSPELYFPFDLFTHITHFFNYKVVFLGLFNGQNLDNKYEILLRVTDGNEYVKVILAENKVVGAVLIGETDLEETFENLILNKLQIDHLKDNLLDANIDIEDYFD